MSMVAEIKQKSNGDWYCSKCRMGQSHLVERCEFCYAWFSNYEEVVIERKIEEKDREVEEKGILFLK